MGKNRDRESLIKLIVNTVIHKIVKEHTNRPESVHFLNSEFIEYRTQSEETAKKFNWNSEDKKFIEEIALKKIKEKLSKKYPDVKYEEQEITQELKILIKEIL
ncbi:hypothetical protein HYW75_06910 [Candidatus Pacearchaeota archaeon]|nr:hypothetical protein [Candidatus Pacearchaeota archaeon]